MSAVTLAIAGVPPIGPIPKWRPGAPRVPLVDRLARMRVLQAIPKAALTGDQFEELERLEIAHERHLARLRSRMEAIRSELAAMGELRLFRDMAR